jgi:hypothetical protein
MVGEHAECLKAFPDGADQVLSFIPVKTALIDWLGGLYCGSLQEQS